MKIAKHSQLPRRSILKGLGATLALPWLECMQARSVIGAPMSRDAAPKRLAVLFMPNGVRQDCWTPEVTGRGFELSKTLVPLCDFQQDVLVLTNLWNKGSDSGDGHYVKTAGLLTGTTINKTVGVDLNCNGVSMDQVAARQLGKFTPLPSLELGTEPVSMGVDGVVGYTRVYGGHVSWKGPTSPLAKEIHPRLAYQRMMRAARPDAEASQSDRPLLDLVLEDAKRMRKTLGAADRRRMDEYLESIRSVEERLDRLEQTDSQPWQPRSSLDIFPQPPESIPEKHAEHVRLMLDLIVLAFQTDITRVTTFMFGNSVSNIDFSFLDDVREKHHSLSHHENDEKKLAQYELIARWHVEQMAYLLGRLRAIDEGDANLLDNSMILFGSDLRDGNSHNARNLPILLAGRGGGRISTGQHLSYDKDTPLCNLYLSMLNALDVPVSSFADSTAQLPGVIG